jgi:LysM domain-containing protein
LLSSGDPWHPHASCRWEGRLARGADRFKHTFDSGLDFERPFGHDDVMLRTGVRRRVAGALVVAVGIASVAAGPMTHALGAGDHGMRTVASRRVVVARGETLWSIARRSFPSEDPRLVVDRIVGANGVDVGSIAPGQVLAVPGPPTG